ncbi:RHH-type rel operon transcriptional repressor/antitoxin RelB [Oxalobacteraceae bacterium GrIS 2.11]
MKLTNEKLMTVRLPIDLAEQLKKLAEVTGRNQSAITVAALREYVSAEARQIEDIQHGIAEADRAEFADLDDVNSFFTKRGSV